jgi:tetratricopeptide (TPR) repeat protein
MIDAALLQPLINRLPTLSQRVPHPALPRRLDALFATLLRQAEDGFETEDLIWAVWCDHPVPAYADRMEAATQAMALKHYGEARVLLDRLQSDAPDWAEVWNKSATLHYIEQHDELALIDIGHTLDLEPRHFGALAGLGEICLRQNEPDVARLAYMAALLINPHLHGVVARVQSLQASPLH